MKKRKQEKKTGLTVGEYGRGGRREAGGKQGSIKDDESQVLEAFSKFAVVARLLWSLSEQRFTLKPSEAVCLPLVFGLCGWVFIGKNQARQTKLRGPYKWSALN